MTTLARLLTRHGNRVGAVFYGGEVERTIPARGGRIQVLRLINDLLRAPRHATSPLTDLTPLLEAGQHSIKGRSLVFVISDFISAPGWERPLNLLTQRHEVLAVRLFDRREMELPDVGALIMEDAETGEQLYVDTHDKGFRRRFREAADQRESDPERRLQAIRGRRRLAVDRRGPGRGDRADGHTPAAAAALAMSFIWPPMLLLALTIPIGVALYLVRDRRRRRRIADFGHLVGGSAGASGAVGSGRSAPSGRLRRRIPAALFVAGLTILVLAVARPQSVVSVPRVEGTVILVVRRLGQHGRRRPGADPDGGGQGRGARVRRTPAVDDADRRRRLQRQRLLDPGPDRRPDPGAGRHRPARPRARHVARPRHPHVADDDRDRR